MVSVLRVISGFVAFIACLECNKINSTAPLWCPVADSDAPLNELRLHGGMGLLHAADIWGM
jgi:hypothetical protein